MIKSYKKNFHNWHNKLAQIFYLLNQTVYFERQGEKLVLKEGKNSYKDSAKDNAKIRPKRSMNEKKLYFTNIDGFSHSKITQRKNRNIVINIEIDDIILSDYSENKIRLKFNQNILYKKSNKCKMKEYNNELLTKLN